MKKTVERVVASTPNTSSSTQVSVHTGGVDAVLQASPVVQLTLLALLFMSILCWAVALSKFKQLKAIHTDNEKFLSRFWKSKSMDSVYEEVEDYKDSNIARVFKESYPTIDKHMNGFERVLRKSIDQEVAAMEARLGILATTGSTGPFIGLFGTVWGLMSAFQKIGATGSASLAVVAPGISEALITTAIGLVTAIPAVILYNHFVTKIRREELNLNGFGADLLNTLKKE